MGDRFEESARLAALRSYELLDTPVDAALDDIVQVAARLCSAPISLVTLVDEHRQWFKANVGMPGTETPRNIAFCDHAIRYPGPLTVENCLSDPRFENNPLVTGDLNVRFYCGVPLRTPDGHALGTLCILDRVPRTLEPATLETLTRLARLVESQLELRRRLVRVDKALVNAEQAASSKELLAAMVVHDLRSPLTAINLLSQALASTPGVSSAVVADLVEAAQTMSRMLNDLLDVCLGDLGRFDVRKRQLDAAEQLQAHARGWRVVAAHKSQHVELELPRAAVPLSADPDLLERVLSNLVGNALKFSPPRTLTRVVLAAEPGWVRFEVADSAPPIPADKAQSLFVPFSRLDPSGPRGHGLGLSFCKLATDAHGGRIGVRSTEAGNRFFVELPG